MGQIWISSWSRKRDINLKTVLMDVVLLHNFKTNLCIKAAAYLRLALSNISALVIFEESEQTGFCSVLRWLLKKYIKKTEKSSTALASLFLTYQPIFSLSLSLPGVYYLLFIPTPCPGILRFHRSPQKQMLWIQSLELHLSATCSALSEDLGWIKSKIIFPLNLGMA